MKAAKIGLLILILGFGATVETAYRVREHMGGYGHGWRLFTGKFDGTSFRFESEESRTVPAGTAVQVENAFGKVSIAQGTEPVVKIAFTKVVFLPTEEKAREFASRVKLVATDQAGRLLVGTNRREVEGSYRDVGFETHLSLTVPPQTAVKIDNEHGRIDVMDVSAADVSTSHDAIRVERVAGPVTVKGRHGDVLVAAVTGTVRAELRHGGFEARDVDGSVTIDSEHGSIDVERVGGLVLSAAHGDVELHEIRGELKVVGRHAGVVAIGVTGRAQVETSYNDVSLDEMGGDVAVEVEHGGVRVEDVTGAAKVRATYNDVSLARIGGATDVDVRHGGVRAQGLAKDAVIRALGGEVEVDGFRAGLDVASERAGVHLSPGGPIVSPVQVRTTNGDVEVEIPAGSALGIEATARRGDVSHSVADLSTTSSDPQRLVGRLGTGGPLVRLEVDHGNIRIRQSSAVAAQSH